MPPAAGIAVVLDTNVVVSAVFFKQGKPGEVFRWVLHHGQILLSLPVLEELTEVLSRRKFGRYIQPVQKDEFLQTPWHGVTMGRAEHRPHRRADGE